MQLHIEHLQTTQLRQKESKGNREQPQERLNPVKEIIEPVGLHSRTSFRHKHPMVFWIVIPLLILAVVVIIAIEVVLHRAEPILRHRVMQTLSTRFKSRVDLGSLHVSVSHGFEVSGEDLALYPYNLESTTPIFSIKSFSFHTSYGNLLRTPMAIGYVSVSGLRINLPPKSQRKQLPSMRGDNGTISIFVDEIGVSDAVLVLGTDKPGKVPLEFDIQHLVLQSVGKGQPMRFMATLTNPKPVGDIQSTGYFGPWNTDDPGDSAVGGRYSFSNADLGTLKGIGGILSSSGRYQGTLDNIVVDGETNTPDFQVNISGHKVPLHTDFHAIVDGTSGDTYLQPVIAHFLHSTLTAKGYVVREPGVPGHHIVLDVVMNQAEIQDLLRLGVRTDPPVMTGKVKMRTKLDLPPGPEDVPSRLKLRGTFEIFNAYFTNPKVQSRVDELSLRSQGQPKLAKQESRDPHTANISSKMKGNFTLSDRELTISNLLYDVPGAEIKLNGVYSLDGNKFDFYGTARLKATISKMVGGWKGLLLTPADPFFKKKGAGTELPIRITGTKSEPHFGLNFGHHGPNEQKQKEKNQSH
ncbi:MAG TPA: AsmA-like C-terminal region-containing protein [Acidobacteriaceae bacterium]